jgi:prepilin-type N-terminal cleavage/methylation domain-containing protein
MIHSQRLHGLIRHDRGFSLVELMVALTIIAIGILWVGQLFSTSSQNASFGRSQTEAVSLTREIQEKIMCEAVSQVQGIFNGVDTNSPGTLTTPCQIWAAHLHSQLGPTARGRIWVKNPAQDPSLLAGMYSVHIEVTWIARGDTMSVPMHFAVTQIDS